MSTRKQQARYYGEADPRRLTYLEFGSIDRTAGRKDVWDFRVHQQAYDFFMLARYTNDLMLCRRLGAAARGRRFGPALTQYAAGVHANDFPIVPARLAAGHTLARRVGERPVTLLELGSTLMGCIDQLETLQAIGARAGDRFSTVDLSRMRYRGVDISPLLNDVARALHPQHAIRVSTRAASARADLFVAKGVTLLYAAPRVTDLVRWITGAEVALFDYSFALDRPQRRHLGTGKQVLFHALGEVVDRCTARGRAVLMRAGTCRYDPASGRLRGQCYCGEPRLLRRVIDEEWRLMGLLAEAVGSAGADLPDLFERATWPPTLAAFRRDFVRVDRLARRVAPSPAS